MTIKSFSRLVRLPNLVAIMVFQTLLQYALIVPYLQRVGAGEGLAPYLFVLLVVATVCIAGGGNAINDYFDVPADRVNRPDRVVVGAGVCRRQALLTHVILTLIGLFAGGYVAFVLRRGSFMLMFVAIPTLLWFYSTHFKRQFLIGNVVVALLVALTGYIVVSADFAAVDRMPGGLNTSREPMSSIWYLVCAYCIFAFLTNLGREIIKDLEDAEGDRALGCHTVALELGASYTKAVVIIIELFTAAMMGVAACHVWQLPLTIYICAALIVPTFALCVMTLRGKTSADYHRASLVSKLIMMAGVGSIFFF